jgi:phosphatidylinositol-3-phosphatase
MKALINKLGLCLLPLLCISAASAQTLPSFKNVFIVFGENADYSLTYNPRNMPYLTSLANEYGLGVNYYSDTHPSIGNYFNAAAGFILTDSDSQTPQSFPISKNNIALEVQNAGLTWKDYVESLPSVKNCGGLKEGDYYVRHDPLEYMTTVNKETSHYVCFSEFETDLANHNLPNFSWLAPNGCDDAHDCPIGDFDTWLKKEIAPLVKSSYFQPGGAGLLIIVFDENGGDGTPNCSTTVEAKGCGGQVELVVVSPFSKKGYKSPGGDPRNYNKSYDAADILRLMAEGLGLPTSDLGWAAKGVPMADFFK